MPDSVDINMNDKSCQIIDEVNPEDKYQDRAGEVRRMRLMKTQVIPVVVGAVGSIPRRLKENLNVAGVNTPIGLIQKSVLLVSARIISQKSS